MEEAEKGELLERDTKPWLDSHPGPTVGLPLFTDDLILEILSRLPVRSLHRFKCVSVSWRDLITDPANRKKLPQTLAGFFYMTINNRIGHHFASVSGDSAAPFNLSIPYLHNNKYGGITQLDACNGLLLYCGFKKKMESWDDFCFLVCNPATGRWVELPPRPPVPASRYCCTTSLAFDTAVSSHFNVLHFEQTVPGAYITGVNIYSSRTGAWRFRSGRMVEKVVPLHSKCVFVGGMMYLIGNLMGFNKYVLMVVDAEGEVWKTIPVQYGRRSSTIGVSQGCLHYVVASTVSVNDSNEILGSGITLWCLKDRDSKELVLKRSANINELMGMIGEKYRVAEIHPDCDTVFLMSSGGDTLVAYDMQHQKVDCILNLEKGITKPKRFLPYVPLFSESCRWAVALPQATPVLPPRTVSSFG
ncbi:hypothetical protein CFC21_095178 [Triticum aestivum]|uniref:F-box domain-containing protein n=3 Tax=Triticum TaxID=4564 RepID=A0A9R0Z0B9_TRITD|nr:putative F-box protein At2g16220 [Triticum aestivum]KAF7092720.1 hypothetical protein CFC21_095178 [Triticum aestivum]VAI68609.1 unnamed protein product [Triticum turgidum subsp. durum]